MSRSASQRIREAQGCQTASDHAAPSRPRSGMTLTETLVTVAIMVILMAFAGIAGTSYRTSMRMMELDNAAHAMYNTLQNRLTSLQSNGRLDYLLSLTSMGNGGNVVTKADVTTDDASTTYPGVWTDGTDIHYLSSNTSSDKATVAFLVQGSDGSTRTAAITEGLSAGCWIIELSPTTAEIYSVFYWEPGKDGTKTLDAAADYSDVIAAAGNRSRDARTSSLLGYYGGGAVGDKIDRGHVLLDDISWDLVNAEELYVDVTSTQFDRLESLLRGGSTLEFQVEVKGKAISGEDSDWTFTRQYSYEDLSRVISANKAGGKGELYLPLDSMNSSANSNGSTIPWSFYNIMCGALDSEFGGTSTLVYGGKKVKRTRGIRNDVICPGSDITVSVNLSIGGIRITKNNLGESIVDNSLFASNRDATVTVSELRHLNNLRDFDESEGAGIRWSTAVGVQTAFTNIRLADDIFWDWTGRSAHIVSPASRTNGAAVRPITSFEPIVLNSGQFATTNDAANAITGACAEPTRVSTSEASSSGSPEKVDLTVYRSNTGDRLYVRDDGTVYTRSLATEANKGDSDGYVYTPLAGVSVANSVVTYNGIDYSPTQSHFIKGVKIEGAYQPSGDAYRSAGLFTRIGSSVDHINLVSFEVNNTSTDGSSETGSLAGRIQPSGGASVTVDSVNVTGTVSGKGLVGGITGSTTNAAGPTANARSMLTACTFGLAANGEEPDTTSKVTSASSAAGGIVAKANSAATLDSCTVAANVSGGVEVGGLIGAVSQTSDITSCNVTGTVDKPITVTATGEYVGGLVGNYKGGAVTSSRVLANVTGNSQAGGAFGEINASVKVSIDGTSVHGTTSTADSYTGGDGQVWVTSTGSNIGGFAGYIKKSESGAKVNITNCSTSAYVLGTADNKSWIGGFVGRSLSPKAVITNCYAASALTSQVTGTVGSYTADYVGGFVGQFGSVNDSGGTISNCYTTANAVGQSHVGGFAGYAYNGTLENNSAYCWYAENGTQYSGFCSTMAADAESKVKASSCVYLTGFGTAQSLFGDGRSFASLKVSNGGGTASPYTSALGDVFPFALPEGESQHVGDWTEPKVVASQTFVTNTNPWIDLPKGHYYHQFVNPDNPNDKSAMIDQWDGYNLTNDARAHRNAEGIVQVNIYTYADNVADAQPYDTAYYYFLDPLYNVQIVTGQSVVGEPLSGLLIWGNGEGSDHYDLTPVSYALASAPNVAIDGSTQIEEGKDYLITLLLTAHDGTTVSGSEPYGFPTFINPSVNRQYNLSLDISGFTVNTDEHCHTMTITIKVTGAQRNPYLQY